MKKMLALAVVVTAVAITGASTAKAEHCPSSRFGSSYGSGFRSSYYPSSSFRGSYYPSSSYRSRSSYYPSRSYYTPSSHHHHHGGYGRGSYGRSGGLYIRSGSFVFGIR